MHATDITELRDLVDVCSRDAFAAAGAEMERDSDAPDPNTNGGEPVAAFIGFGGNKLRGTVTITAPFDFFQRTHPLAGASAEISSCDVFDWSSEFANQLVGRIKNKLLHRGVEIQASLPKSALAKGLILSSSSATRVCAMRFRGEDSSACVWVDATSDATTLFEAPAEDELPAAEEGCVVLF
jgi:hypothetical protein